MLELLSPAGSLKAMRYAFAYGADAVYAGLPRYSLRVRNNEFDHKNLAIGITEAHSKHKKLYVVVNIAPHNAKLKTFIADIKPIVDMHADALIMSDPGLIMLARENFPDIAIHLSVQANAINWATVKFWQRLGLTRIILSRELSLEEIAEIRQQVPDIELEVFVHGALCMAYSGRCLLSGYINHRDSNQGACANVCRWQYNVKKAREDEIGNIIQPPPTLGLGVTTNEPYVIEDITRQGEYLPVSEDEHGTYIMNSRDLRAVEHIETLLKIGVQSVKIEGRTKSAYYSARTAGIYRQAIADALNNKPFDKNLLSQLESLAHRGYTDGFLRRQRHEQYQCYDYSSSIAEKQKFVGEFTGIRRNGFAEVRVKNRFVPGDDLLIITPKNSYPLRLNNMKDKNLQDIEIAPGDSYVVHIPVDPDLDLDFALLVKNL